MNATQLLHNLGQSLWLDNITRDLLTSGALSRYIDDRWPELIGLPPVVPLLDLLQRARAEMARADLAE